MRKVVSEALVINQQLQPVGKNGMQKNGKLPNGIVFIGNLFEMRVLNLRINFFIADFCPYLGIKTKQKKPTKIRTNVRNKKINSYTKWYM